MTIFNDHFFNGAGNDQAIKHKNVEVAADTMQLASPMGGTGSRPRPGHEKNRRLAQL